MVVGVCVSSVMLDQAGAILNSGHKNVGELLQELVSLARLQPLSALLVQVIDMWSATTSMPRSSSAPDTFT